jgi:hypothetical protein
MAEFEFTNKLLKEAIADAEAVRQTAIENAKLSLEESFTPQIKSMISRRLRAEAEGMEHDDEEEKKAPEMEKKPMETEEAKEVDAHEAEPEGKSDMNLATSDIGASDNKEPSASAFDSAEDDHSGEDAGEGETEWYEDWTEADFDLDEVIKELEADLQEMKHEEEGEEELDEAKKEEEEEELDESWSEGKEEEGEEENEAYPAEEPEAGTMKPEVPAKTSHIGTKEEGAEMAADVNKFVTEPSEPKMEGEEEMKGHEEEGEEEELDLEAILKELEAEDEMEKHKSEKMASLEKELAEYRKAVQLLRGKLNEVNLLNAKLLYTNKIFRKEGLTTEQKVSVIENFDRASSVREVKMVYTVLVETLTSTAKAVKAVKSTKVVTEGFASKATPSTAPKATEVISENSVAKRLQQLAGLI